MCGHLQISTFSSRHLEVNMPLFRYLLAGELDLDARSSLSEDNSPDFMEVRCRQTINNTPQVLLTTKQSQP